MVAEDDVKKSIYEASNQGTKPGGSSDEREHVVRDWRIDMRRRSTNEEEL